MRLLKLYPAVEDVLEDTALRCYFKPICSVMVNNYKVHLFSTDGLVCINEFEHSEDHFFGFSYNGGKYAFLGNRNVFASSGIEDFYNFLSHDFKSNSYKYCSDLYSLDQYLKCVHKEFVNFGNFSPQDIQAYAKSFYCYEMGKLLHEQTGKFYSFKGDKVSCIENYSPVLLFNEDIFPFAEEFLFSTHYNDITKNYDISHKAAVYGMEAFSFTFSGGICIAFIDDANQIIYNLEYFP